MKRLSHCLFLFAVCSYTQLSHPMLRFAKQTTLSLKPRTMLLQKRSFLQVPLIDNDFIATLDKDKNGRIVFLQKLNEQCNDLTSIEVNKRNIDQNIHTIRNTMYCNRYALQLQKLLTQELQLTHPTEEIKQQAAAINSRVWGMIRQIEEKRCNVATE